MTEVPNAQEPVSTDARRGEREALEAFRDHVIRHACVWDEAANGSHHHPIWAQVASALNTPAQEPQPIAHVEAVGEVNALFEVLQLLTPPGNVWTGNEPDWQAKAWSLLERAVFPTPPKAGADVAAVGREEDEALLVDANSWYSPEQIEEMHKRADHLRAEIRRCWKAIENGDSDPWWKEDRDRFKRQLDDIEAALLTTQPSAGE